MDERVHLSKVAFDQGVAARAGKRLFMCRHQGRSPDTGLDQIAARHDLDAHGQGREPQRLDQEDVVEGREEAAKEARRLPAMVVGAGFSLGCVGGHSFVDRREDGYMMSVVDRGSDLLAQHGQISPQAAEALRAEARRRVSEGAFFGHVAYVSVHASKP